MRRRELSKALIASATGAGLLAQRTQAQEYAQSSHPQSPAEHSAGIVPTNQAYPCGDLRRYGGDPTGANDSSAAWQAAINCGYAVIPQGCSFKIVTGATKSGQVTIVGSGRSSKLLCDGTILTVMNGTASCVDNLWLENITAPWIISRDPANWAAAVLGSLRQSNTALGYQPTVNDADVWHSLTPEQQNQQIGPALRFAGAATDITVSRVYGRFVRIDVMDAQYSTVCNCDIRGGKGVWGAINFDNAANGVQRGIGNLAIGNTVRYASFNGIIFQNNEGPLAEGNIVQYCGESGIKAAAGPNSTACIRANIAGNHCDYNYYDGIDLVTKFPTDDSTPAYHQAIGNHCYNNGGDGINLDGRYNQCVGNFFVHNGRFGIWCTGSFSSLKDNFCIDNNQTRNSSYAEILGGNVHNSITGNFICCGAGANSAAIHAHNTHYIANNHAIGADFSFGATAAATTAFLANNIDSTTGLQVEQSFVWSITNNAGTLQHTTCAQSGTAALGNFQSRILNASANPTNTPAGADRTTAMAAGWKIGGTSTNNAWADTNDQLTAANALLMASIAYNDTGTELTVRPQIVRIEINRVTRYRLAFQFHSAGNPFALDTTNIPPGKTVQVQFYGRLA
jgi:hypothetical protein